MNYLYLLFDADNTLFNFDRANQEAFHAVCRRFDIPDSDETFALYERCNNEMWAAFDRGECTKEFLVVQRFRNFLSAMGLDRDAEGCNALHLHTLSQCAFMLPYAEEVCHTLARSHKLYLVTNAVASVQRGRLAKSPIVPDITAAFIRRRAPPSHRRRILTMCSLTLTASPRTTALSSVTASPAISGARITTACPAAGTIPATRPARMACASTMRSTTCGRCMILYKIKKDASESLHPFYAY